VVINKADRPDAEPDKTHEAVFDLFVALDANDEQLDFPTLYASGRSGWAVKDLKDPHDSLAPLFDTILDYVPLPAPLRDPSIKDKPFAMLATLLDRDPYVGRMLTGRIDSGTVRTNMPVKVLNRDGETVEQFRISKLFAFRGLDKIPVEEASAGDIVSIAGFSEGTVADTICALEVNTPLKAQPIDPPTLAMTFSPNTSPLAGREGTKVQSRVIRDRLMQEAESNVAIRVTASADNDAFEVAGRGELQLGVLIETMRREGFELSISRPRVLYREDPETGERLEPLEEVMIDVDEAYTGTVVEKMTERR